MVSVHTSNFLHSMDLIYWLYYKDEHRQKQRKMLNPVFAASRLRDMAPILYDV